MVSGFEEERKKEKEEKKERKTQLGRRGEKKTLLVVEWV